MTPALNLLLETKFLSPNFIEPLSGGSINEVFHVQTKKHDFVVKINEANSFPKMFEKEAKGLNQLRQSSFTIPEVCDVLELGQYQYLLLSYIKEVQKSEGFWKRFGYGLAELHKVSSDTFGWTEHNYMGSLPQSNAKHHDWSEFYWQERILPQLTLALRNQFFKTEDIKYWEEKLIPWLQSQEDVNKSLLHGDLWSGNFMTGFGGEPVLIDPATHFGNRETEIAMTKLFGGFHPDFYRYYTEAWPLTDGWEKRIEIYQLYPLLIHLNLFGNSYLSSIKRIYNQL